MSPEALARLRDALEFSRRWGNPRFGGEVTDVRTDDLRALLAAFEESSAQVDAARARGVTEERARVVAWLRAADSETLVWFAAQRIERGEHAKEDSHG